MAFVPVPKDLNRVKTKVMFNLTKRQLICFSIAAAVGVPIFFLAKVHLDLSTAAMLMVVIADVTDSMQHDKIYPPRSCLQLFLVGQLSYN